MTPDLDRTRRCPAVDSALLYDLDVATAHMCPVDDLDPVQLDAMPSFSAL